MHEIFSQSVRRWCASCGLQAFRRPRPSVSALLEPLVTNDIVTSSVLACSKSALRPFAGYACLSGLKFEMSAHLCF